jgi:predicted CXXCH cytochrome family protein
MNRFLVITLALLLWPVAACAEEVKILRPVNRSAWSSESLDIIAAAPQGKLELDGKTVVAEQPFPGVLHATLKAPPGEHQLVLRSPDGAAEIRFYSGPRPPPEFAEFHQHPPGAILDCNACHELTKRGRFHFKGAEACFSCHENSGFAKAHTHTSAVLNQCGLCHNAHGSTVKAHLLYPKETACKQCHN